MRKGVEFLLYKGFVNDQGFIFDDSSTTKKQTRRIRFLSPLRCVRKDGFHEKSGEGMAAKPPFLPLHPKPPVFPTIGRNLLFKCKIILKYNFNLIRFLTSLRCVRKDGFHEKSGEGMAAKPHSFPYTQRCLSFRP